MKPGRAVRVDYEYERNGTSNLFMLFAPLEGWRRVKVTDRHTAIDYAHVLKHLAEISLAVPFLGWSSGYHGNRPISSSRPVPHIYDFPEQDNEHDIVTPTPSRRVHAAGEHPSKALRRLTVGQQGRSRTFLTWGCFPRGAIVSRGQFSKFVVGHNFASFHSRDITDFV
jgi:hypothetical protein